MLVFFSRERMGGLLLVRFSMNRSSSVYDLNVLNLLVIFKKYLIVFEDL